MPRSGSCLTIISCQRYHSLHFPNEYPFQSRNGRIGRKEVTGNTEEVPIELIITKIATNNGWNGRDQLVRLTNFGHANGYIAHPNGHVIFEKCSSSCFFDSVSYRRLVTKMIDIILWPGAGGLFYIWTRLFFVFKERIFILS